MNDISLSDASGRSAEGDVPLLLLLFADPDGWSRCGFAIGLTSRSINNNNMVSQFLFSLNNCGVLIQFVVVVFQLRVVVYLGLLWPFIQLFLALVYKIL